LGVVETDSGTLTYRNINSDFYVIEVTELYGPRGTQLRLKVANIDRYEVDEARVVLGALEEIKVNGLSTKPYFSHYTYADKFEIDDSHQVSFDLVITNAVQAVHRVVLRIVTTPFRSTAGGAASGGGSTSGSGGSSSPTSSSGGSHRHRFAVYITSGGLVGTRQNYLVRDSGNNGQNVELYGPASVDLYTYDAAANHTHSVSIPNHTHSVPNHTHPQAFTITDDSQYPDNIDVEVNGTQVANNLDASGVGLNVEIDITDQINAAATLQQAHTIEISCAGGQGLAKIHLDVFEVISSIGQFA
jgi:hypothetical protein